MVLLKIQYQFKAAPWRYEGPNGWVFVSLPTELSKEIREIFKSEEAGWGRLTATARIENTEWKTAIWFDTKANTYLLPLKSAIRSKESVVIGKAINVSVFI
jgi:Domain of unknown function (DUF1905)